MRLQPSSVAAGIIASLRLCSAKSRSIWRLKVYVLIGVVICYVLMKAVDASSLLATPQSGSRQLPPTPTEPFSPSNARTEDGDYIRVEQFFSASRCLNCHQDTHAAWSESLHRNAAREPFYRESADILLRTRGIEFTRHCESCHTPVALFSGALARNSGKAQAPFTPLDHEGVTCSVCHSITEARLDGTGSFTIRRPALLAKEDGTPIFGNFTDEQILADVPGHKRAVMRPLLRQPEFCATCHKVDAPPSLNGYKNIRGFSAYDEWQQSGASQESVQPFYPRAERADCRTCHMSKVASLNDRAAKQGKIASHRWLGANTAAPLFYDQHKQAELTENFLKMDVLDVDIFGIKREATGELIAPLLPDSENCFTPLAGEEIVAEVIISNRNAAHTFPPEVRDLYEAWVEFEIIDASGKTLYHSGYVQPDGPKRGMLDESAHVYKQIILDEQARPITRHQIWLTNVKAYDNAIPPGRSDIARFRFRLPDETEARGPITLRARANYRRLNQEYTNYVLGRQKRELVLPVVRMAEAITTLTAGAGSVMPDKEANKTAPQSGNKTPQWKRWNDYGIGLLEQGQYGQAARAFLLASRINTTDPNPLVNAAIAELSTERYGHDKEQLNKAALLLDDALNIAPTHWRSRYYKAITLRASGKLREAADMLLPIAETYPRDREVQRQLGQVLFLLGNSSEAASAFKKVLRIDPTDWLAWQLLIPVYSGLGQKEEAKTANRFYLTWRDDPQVESITARFYAAHPQWAEERPTVHVHGIHSAQRSVVVREFAAPDK